MVNMGIAVVGLLDGYNAVIPFLFFLWALFSLDDSDDATFQQTTGESRLIHQNQHVGGIAIPGKGRRYKAKIVGEGHTRR